MKKRETKKRFVVGGLVGLVLCFLLLAAAKKGGETKMIERSEHEEVATLAAGCFWGVEGILRKIPGVLDTEVGYTGGGAGNATYRQITTGKTGHAEAVRVVFDSERLSYEALLRYFFRLHDPTTLDRQGNDWGTQYRSAIFVHNDEQRAVARRVKEKVNSAGKWDEPVVTNIEDAVTFYPAEEYHQDYLVKNPHGYSCHYLRP